MRTLKLSHEEIEIITTALQFVYDKKINTIKNNLKILSSEAVREIVKKADEYSDLQCEIAEGKKDV